MGYCDSDNVNQIIGNLPVASGITTQDFIDSAEAEMHTYMIGLYNVPIEIKSSVATTTSGVTTNILQSINQDLAGGRLILALDTTMENEQIHGYAEYLVENAIKKLEDIRNQKMLLIGATLDEDKTDDKARFGIVSSSSPDSSSYFNRDYKEIANPQYEVTDGIDIS